MRFIPICLIVISILAGCAGEYVPRGKVVHQLDGAVRDEKVTGLNLKITRFEWQYQAATDRIIIDGWAENLSKEAVEGCRILATVVDQFNYPLGVAEAYVTPTYLDSGQVGRFELTLQRGKWVKAIHMNYRFEKRY